MSNDPISRDIRQRAGKTAWQTFAATVLLAVLMTAYGQLGNVDDLATVDWGRVAGVVCASGLNAALAAGISYIQNTRAA